MNQAIRGLQKNTPTHPTPRHWTWFHNLASPGVLFWCPTNGGVLFSHPFLKKGAVSNLFFFFAKQHPFRQKGVLFCKIVPLCTGVLFSHFPSFIWQMCPPLARGGGGPRRGFTCIHPWGLLCTSYRPGYAIIGWYLGTKFYF